MTTITSSTVRFQASIETIRGELDKIQTEWTEQGITDTVMDETGEIHPDAEAELLDRLLEADDNVE